MQAGNPKGIRKRRFPVSQSPLKTELPRDRACFAEIEYRDGGKEVMFDVVIGAAEQHYGEP